MRFWRELVFWNYWGYRYSIYYRLRAVSFRRRIISDYVRHYFAKKAAILFSLRVSPR
ncbi:hypothetical protein VTN02DRAFT_6465 [Thermoascus thermophilus]